MDCKQNAITDYLERYAAGTLDPAAADELELHLLECPRCVEAVEALEVAREELRFRAHEIRVLPSRSRWFDARVWVPALAAAMILCVAGGRWLYKREQPVPVAEAPQAGEPPRPLQVAPAQVEAPATQGQTPAHSQEPQIASSASKPRPAEAKAEKKQELPASTQETEVAQQPPAPAAIPDEKPKPVEQKPVVAKSQTPTDEQALELYRLGAVGSAPPYSAAGAAAGSKAQKAPEQNTLAVGGANGGPSSFDKAMIFYVDRDYVRAAELLEAAATALGASRPAKVDFYLGVCRLLNGHAPDAAAPLKRVIADGKSPLVPAAHLYLARVYIQAGALADAESELEHATERPGVVKTQATDLLVRLRALRKSMSETGTTPVPQ